MELYELEEKNSDEAFAANEQIETAYHYLYLRQALFESAYRNYNNHEVFKILKSIIEKSGHIKLFEEWFEKQVVVDKRYKNEICT